MHSLEPNLSQANGVFINWHSINAFFNMHIYTFCNMRHISDSWEKPCRMWLHFAEYIQTLQNAYTVIIILGLVLSQSNYVCYQSTYYNKQKLFKTRVCLLKQMQHNCYSCMEPCKMYLHFIEFISVYSMNYCETITL